MREFKSISASQVSKHDECRRAWWFQYVMGLPVPQKASAALGEAMHLQLENYLNDGTPPDESTPAGRIAKAGLKFLPKPGTVFTEVPMSSKKKREDDPDPDVPLPGNMPKLIIAGMPVNGFIDVLDLSGPHPVVIDHKCLPASAVVHTSEGPRRVGDLASEWVCAAWTGTELVAATALPPVDGGVQQVFRVNLNNGMTGRFGHSHPILVRERGWVTAEDLRVGDEVAVPLNLPDLQELPVPDALIKVTAMLLCDGALKSDTLTYTKAGETRAEYVRLLKELGVPCVERKREGHIPYVQVSAAEDSPLRHMLKDIGVDFVSSPMRRVPSRLMGMSRRQVGVFLGGIWAGDGAAYLVNVSGKQKPVITFANRSKAFCEDVRDLLLRAGFAATFTETRVPYKGERHPYYAATVVGKRSKVAFLERAVAGDILVGDRCSGRKTRAGNTPPPLTEVLAAARGMSEHAKGPRPVRIGEGDLWWVPVVAVSLEGAEPCFNIEVPLHHTFVAEGIVTHNSTSDLKWAKTEADLREDVQGVIYGSFALDVVEAMGVHADVVEFGHVVYLTKGAPLAKATRVTLTREHLALERKNLEVKVNEMKVTAQARTPAAVEGNASACRNYGGCHFRDKCSALGMFENAASTGLFKNIETVTSASDSKENDTMTTDPMAAIRAIQAKKAAAAASGTDPFPLPAPAPTPAPAPAPAPSTHTAAPAPKSGPAASVLAKYGIKGASAASTTEAAPSIVPSDVPAQGKTTLGVTAPAPAPAPEPVAAPVADDGEKKTVRKPRDYQAKLAALSWTSEQVGRMSADAMRAAIEGNLDGRSYSVRPDGSIYVPGVGVLDVSHVAPVEEEEEEAFAGHVGVPDAAPSPEAVVKALSPEVFVSTQAQLAKMEEVKPAPAPVAAPVQQYALVLYIDCVPDKGRDRDYILLEDYIQPLLPQVVDAYNRGCKRDDEKVPHYSLIPYARGPGFVAALVMSAPPVGIIVANTRFPATNAILEVLIPMADVVVRGVR